MFTSYFAHRSGLGSLTFSSPSALVFAFFVIPLPLYSCHPFSYIYTLQRQKLSSPLIIEISFVESFTQHALRDGRRKLSQVLATSPLFLLINWVRKLALVIWLQWRGTAFSFSSRWFKTEHTQPTFTPVIARSFVRPEILSPIDKLVDFLPTKCAKPNCSAKKMAIEKNSMLPPLDDAVAHSQRC